jgi:hypothetical protein
MNGGVRKFRVPTLEDVLKHRVIVVTLSISMYLSTLGLRKGMDHTMCTTFNPLKNLSLLNVLFVRTQYMVTVACLSLSLCAAVCSLG